MNTILDIYLAQCDIIKSVIGLKSIQWPKFML